MCTLLTLNKIGKPLKTEVRESVEEVWRILVGWKDVNSVNCANEFKENKDFILLTSSLGTPIIIQKRYIWKFV